MNNQNILEYQYEFLKSEAKSALMLGGIGSGKSFSGGLLSINCVSEYPNATGLIVANTFTQLMNATVPALTGILDTLHIPYNCVLSGSRKRIEILDTEILLYSLQNYETIRGIEVGWIWGDEVAFAKEEAIKVIKGRLRDKNGPLIERYTSSPNGFNYLYDWFEHKDGQNKTNKHHLIRAKTIENIFLPDGYYESLLEDYGGADNPLAQQELFGQFVNLVGGNIYWAFNRNKILREVNLNKNYPVYVGQDFNIGNMANCYLQLIEGDLLVCEETVLDHAFANTDHASSKIVEDLTAKGFYPKVVPDSTGKAAKTSARGNSDLDIMRSYGLEIVNTSNPLIRDRQNAVNVAMNKGNLIIHPKCKKLIKELETLSARDKEGDKAHISVGMGYVTNHLKPLRNRKKSSARGGL